MEQNKKQTLSDKKIIEAIIKLETDCHTIDKRRSQEHSKRNKLLKQFTIPENKLLLALENRKLVLREQLLKIKRDIQYEKKLEFQRKKEYRKTIPELQESSISLKQIAIEQDKLYDELRCWGEKHSKLYSKAWEIYKKRRDKLKEESQ